MLRGLKDFFNKMRQVNTETESDGPAPLRPSEVLGEMELKDLIKYSFKGDYFFHGSPIKLEPGVDWLQPNSFWNNKNVLYVGELNRALRFALVRGWGIDQRYGTDFFVFASRNYKLVIYNAAKMSDTWHNKVVDKSAYVYAVPKWRLFDTDLGVVDCAMPIVARAEVNQQTLADAGFEFVPDATTSTRFWWGIENTDREIQNRVLAYLPFIVARQEPFIRERQR